MWKIRFAFPDLVCLDTPIDERPDVLLSSSMNLTAERFMSASEFDSDSFSALLDPSIRITIPCCSPFRSAALAGQTEAPGTLNNSG